METMFHPDELAAQSLAGLTANSAAIRPFMPDQHREFFAMLPYLFIATADSRGWPIASVLSGTAGLPPPPPPPTPAQYIQTRTPAPRPTGPGATEHLAALDDDARRLIGNADTFFVASRSRTDAPNGGIDMSHRGGRPGFVDLRDDTLVIPDFRGN